MLRQNSRAQIASIRSDFALGTGSSRPKIATAGEQSRAAAQAMIDKLQARKA